MSGMTRLVMMFATLLVGLVGLAQSHLACFTSPAPAHPRGSQAHPDPLLHASLEAASLKPLEASFGLLKAT